MRTRLLLLFTFIVVVAFATAPLSADECSASASVKPVTKEAKAGAPAKPAPVKPGATSKLPVTAYTYTVPVEVEVSGCPESPHRHSKFAGPTHGTLTYTYKKTYGDRSSADGRDNLTWSDNDKALALSAKIDGQDGKGIFEVGDVKVEKVVCGCR